MMNVDQAMTLGLIVNELVTNAIKHAFPEKRPGQVSIRFGAAPSTGRILEVADNGVGLADGRIEADSSDGSGLRLALLLAVRSAAAGAIWAVVLVGA